MILWITMAFATPDTKSIPLCETDPQRCSYALSAEPRPTRNPNLLRFSDPALKDPALIPVHVARLLSETDESVQIAILALLHYQDLSEVSESLVTLIDSSSPELRANFVELLPYLSIETQKETIDVLTKDEDWLVREAVVRVIARHLGKSYPTVLVSALNDNTPEVRTQAVKGLGWNDILVPLDSLRPLLLDRNPQVRLHTVRTIHRLHPSKLTTVPEYISIQNDPNSKVKREILRLHQQ